MGNSCGEEGEMRGTTQTICLFAPLLAAALLLSAACSGDGGTKAGGSEAATTLRIGTNDNPGRLSADQILEFGRRVEEASDGKLRIEPVWHAAGEGDQRAWDQRVARKVVRGELDLGLIPARAWDTEGVTTLRALHAPFLVTSDALLARVLTSDLAGRMLAGLDRAGVVGLALLPEGLRHPFSFGAPFLGPADYQGALIRAPRSQTAYALFEALGATPDDLSFTAVDEAIARGRAAAAESAFAFSGSLQGETVATGNVTFFPKVNALVVNDEVFDDLTDEERRILVEASGGTRDWAIGSSPASADSARRYCRGGGRVVLASEADLRALERAARPVYVQLERDRETRTLIAGIRALASDLATRPFEPNPCGKAAAPPATATTAASIDGVYRTSFTRGELERTPLLEDRGEVQDENWGDFTLTFERGRVTFEQENEIASYTTAGTFTVDGRTIVLEFTEGGNFGETFTFRWWLEGGTLTFERVGAAPSPTPYVIKPWRRVVAASPAFPDGVYRVDLPLDYLTARGLEAGEAFGQAGINTLTFDDGRWVHHLEGPATPGDCEGTYRVVRGRVSILVGPSQIDGCGPEGFEVFSARWTLGGSELRFRDVRSQTEDDLFHQVVWGSKPWRKIR
jgi:TRAP-type C4-dicarboxylate transport system substrate-binding protein